MKMVNMMKLLKCRTTQKHKPLTQTHRTPHHAPAVHSAKKSSRSSGA